MLTGLKDQLLLAPIASAVGAATLKNDSPCAQDRDVLIDTAHDKPQAPEGPTYHIENKGEPCLQLFLPGPRALRGICQTRRASALVLVHWHGLFYARRCCF